MSYLPSQLPDKHDVLKSPNLSVHQDDIGYQTLYDMSQIYHKSFYLNSCFYNIPFYLPC